MTPGRHTGVNSLSRNSRGPSRRPWHKERPGHALVMGCPVPDIAAVGGRPGLPRVGVRDRRMRLRGVGSRAWTSPGGGTARHDEDCGAMRACWAGTAAAAARSSPSSSSSSSAPAPSSASSSTTSSRCSSPSSDMGTHTQAHTCFLHPKISLMSWKTDGAPLLCFLISP